MPDGPPTQRSLILKPFPGLLRVTDSEQSPPVGPARDFADVSQAQTPLTNP